MTEDAWCHASRECPYYNEARGDKIATANKGPLAPNPDDRTREERALPELWGCNCLRTRVQ